MPQYATTPVQVTLTASSTKTQLAYQAGADHSALLKKVGISFDGVTATDPVLRVDLLRQTTAGTATTGSLVPIDGNAEAGIGVVKHSHSAEPTAGDILDSWYITPAGGLWVYQWPLGDEIILPPSSYIALRVISGSLTTTTKCNPTMTIVE